MSSRKYPFLGLKRTSIALIKDLAIFICGKILPLFNRKSGRHFLFILSDKFFRIQLGQDLQDLPDFFSVSRLRPVGPTLRRVSPPGWKRAQRDETEKEYPLGNNEFLEPSVLPLS
jgi:hypothetical protein